MKTPIRSALPKATPREPRSRALPGSATLTRRGKESLTPTDNASLTKTGDSASVNESLTKTGEGGEKSGAGSPGTGAGVRKAGSRIKGGGSNLAPDRGERVKIPAVQAEVAIIPMEGPPDLDGPVLGELMGSGGWRRVLNDGDPGVGFYRFRSADVPGAVTTQGNTIEVFAENLEKARAMVTLLQRNRVPGVFASGVLARPFSMRPTRLCKRARKARGE